MSPATSAGLGLAGIDVGGVSKGFHAVALNGGKFEPRRFMVAEELADWCKARAFRAVAIDAPCAWAASGRSRMAERSLAIGGRKVSCFLTPTRSLAMGRAFYGWVFHGEKLYHHLAPTFQVFDGSARKGKVVFETFPQAIVCALAGVVVPAHPKAATRRAMLRDLGYDDRPLTNIDFVDAALCAVTAERFVEGRTRAFGDRAEGFIVVPS